MTHGGFSLFFGKIDEPGYYCRCSHLDEDDMVNADLVEGVLDLEAALDLVCFDKSYENMLHRQDAIRVTCGGCSPCEDIGRR